MTPRYHFRRCRVRVGTGTWHSWKWYRFLLAAALLQGCAARPPAAPETALEQARRQIHIQPPAALSAGAARVEITPSVGTPLAGYGKRRGRPSVGIRDPLYARALALSDGEDTVVIVSADLLIFPPPVAERILRRISEEHGIPRQAIVLAATHTHTGAGSIGHGFLYEQVFGRYRDEVVEGISARISWAVRQALADRRPAEWALARGEGLLQGLIENRAVPSGPVEPALEVLFVRSPEGTPLAILVHAAAHPTLMEWKDMRFSADFPGEVCRVMESSYPGSVCLFVNGAAGDSRPRDALGAGAEERIERFGRALAEGAQGLISRMDPRRRADLACWGMWVQLPEVKVRLGPVPIPPVIGRRMRPTSAFLSFVALNGALLAPSSAELTAELGDELRRRIRARSGKEAVIAGYANGYLGYAVAPERYGEGSYEAWMSWYGEEFGPFLLDHLERLAALYAEGENR